uniref:Uncharacterized protein n=1 Tax=Hucho hucho TaxID=62062 RepID=A0A4W5NAK4_9TELE
MEKQRLLYQQSRLHNRGAAEMVLQMISACRGETGSMVSSTLKLGISILNTGNCDVQQVSSVRCHLPGLPGHSKAKEV